MSNLIVTIIAIALVAIAAVTGAFYGGTAYMNAQLDVVASTIMNEATNILAAERLWASNNNQQDVGGMPGMMQYNNGPGYYAGNSSTNSGMSLLVAGKELSTWPSLAGQPSLPAPGGAGLTFANAPWDALCYNYAGQNTLIYRRILSYNGANYLEYSFLFATTSPNCASSSLINGQSAGAASTLGVSIARRINAKTGGVPANAQMTSYNFPLLPAGNVVLVYLMDGSYYTGLGGDSNATPQTNYCFVDNNNSYWLDCVFGPS